MCGVAGFLDAARPSADARSRALAMIETIRHRGPDDAGVWLSEHGEVALGLRRLAILDLSSAGHQPMVSPGGRYVVAFNGEIYNFRRLRTELEKKGHAFRGGSDTEVVLTSIVEWGFDEALHRFNGMFGLALWDTSERVLRLARDRLGEKPMYYGWSGSTFLFGSELKALRAHPSFEGVVGRDAVASYLRHNFVPGPWSIYEGIRKLPPGTAVTIDPAGPGNLPAPRPFWSMEVVAAHGLMEPFSGRPGEAVDQLHELLQDSVRLRMESDVALGAFLSGGVDSSMVVALMQEQSLAPVKTFTIGFREEGYDEAGPAAAVAKHLGTQHTLFQASPDDALKVIPRLPSLYDEPFGDSSAIPTFLVSRMTREHVTVALSGDGGDELFAGYNRYSLAQAAWSRMRWIPKDVRRVAARLLTAPSWEAWDRVWPRLARWLPASAQVRTPADKLFKLAAILQVERPQDMYTALTSTWPDPGGLVIGGGELPSAINAVHRLEFAEYIEAMMFRDTETYLPDDMLTKVDRASMGTSLEVRVPLLDHRIVELAWRLPLKLKLGDDGGKWVLRQVLGRYLPRELIDRPKMGFGVPVGEWLRGPLREWAETLLDPSLLHAQGLLEPAPILTRWNEHLSGRRNWQESLWGVLMLQAWLAETGSAA